jgi:iron complex outermembrane receptor protein
MAVNQGAPEMSISTRDGRQPPQIRTKNKAPGTGRPGLICRLAQRLGRTSISLVAGLCTAFVVHAASTNGTLPDDLTEMSLEDLMGIEITSVSKKPQKKSEAAAAIFVITNNDLKHWGVTNIPDALRRVPGLQVARIDANKWAITARGFNSRFANKLLVLIDGRSVYTPLFAGVYWEANEVMLEDVERIEVIRGPGGTLWGANAVNGVINVITKSAADTQGNLVTAGTGNEEKGFSSARHGGETSGGKYYRVYGKYRSVDTGGSVNTGILPPAAHDDSEIAQTGFRMDWGKDASDSYTLQGDYYEGKGGQQLLIATSPSPLIDDADYNGGNLTGRWTHRTGTQSEYTFQAYFDYADRDSAALNEDRHTLDIEVQHHSVLKDVHDVVWGLNYRHIRDNSKPTPIFILSPGDRNVNLYSAFLQDEISLWNDRAKLTLGSKFEHNDFTGFEIQPSARFAWITDSGNTIWGAVSRAVRTPARGEHDVKLAVIPPSPAPPPLVISGNANFDSETMTAYELGYRFTPTEEISVDLTAFYNKYDELRTTDVSTPAPPLAAIFENNMEGHTHGFEIDTHWKVNNWLDINANYSWLEVDLDLVRGSRDVISQSTEDASPQHQANIWLTSDLGNRIELDTAIRYVGSLETFGFPQTDSYIAFDARLGWSPRKGVDLSLVGQNLFDGSHPEFNPDFIFSIPTEVERSIYGKITLNF